MENAKVYVDVLVNFDKDGTMSPVDFIWEDGEKYHVDRILARERCASRKAGGTGICYTVMVNGKESHLYYEFAPGRGRRLYSRFRRDRPVRRRQGQRARAGSDTASRTPGQKSRRALQAGV